jgi:CO/xanthine dehydrogenase Mo-binding subunit
MGMHGGGFTGNGERILDSEVLLTIHPEGTVEVAVSSVDIGQGPYTTLAQIVASALGLPLGRVRVPPPCTAIVPNSGPTVASRTVFIVGSILRELCRRILQELGTADLTRFVAENNDLFPREFRSRYLPDETQSFDEGRYVGAAYGDYSWVATVSEIRLNPECYRVEPLASWNVLDIGRVVNPGIAEGQVEGGVMQAWGWALSEVVYRPGHGRVRGFTDYALPMSLDVPRIGVEFIHTDDEVAKGLGEIPMDCPAASIRNALAHATGVFLDALPLTPEAILGSLSAAGRSHELDRSLP